jgi:hypothetical protein
VRHVEPVDYECAEHAGGLKEDIYRVRGGAEFAGEFGSDHRRRLVERARGVVAGIPAPVLSDAVEDGLPVIGVDAGYA